MTDPIAQSLLAATLADPDDAVRRLVLADHLEELGDHRADAIRQGEFLRTTCVFTPMRGGLTRLPVCMDEEPHRLTLPFAFQTRRLLLLQEKCEGWRELQLHTLEGAIVGYWNSITEAPHEWSLLSLSLDGGTFSLAGDISATVCLWLHADNIHESTMMTVRLRPTPAIAWREWAERELGA